MEKEQTNEDIQTNEEAMNAHGINLYDEVVKLMKEESVKQEYIELFEESEYGSLARTNEANAIKRYYLNNHFSLHLMMLEDQNVDIGDSRFSLVQDGEFADWLLLFKRDVLPIIKDNPLV